MAQTILHSDLNNFYASVECLHRPELQNKPVVVGGDVEARHGIVLAKNYIAKKHGIQTAETIWQAKLKCPDLISVPPNFPLYLRYAQMTREIYSNYTNQIEPFGLDESWLDVGKSSKTFGDGKSIADEIRQKVRQELGITVSIGVSYNKIFAKLGSDMKKPDATTVIREDDYKQKIWPLPVEDLLYVGRATKRKLNNIGVYTIGALAQLDESFLRAAFGKWGNMLHSFANGFDRSPVMYTNEDSIVKGIGNSTTTPRDLISTEDVHLVMYVLCESVSARLFEHGFFAKTVQIYIRDNELYSFERQGQLKRASNLSSELHAKSMQLFKGNYDWSKPIRSIGIRATDLCGSDSAAQITFFEDEAKRKKEEQLQEAVIKLRQRFGQQAITRAVLLGDKMGKINPKEDHVIFPAGYFRDRLP